LNQEAFVMSCEGKLGAACAAMLGGGASSALSRAFNGDATEATAVLEETYRVARSQAAARLAPPGNGAPARLARMKAEGADRAAEDATVAFFTYLRDVHHLSAQQLPAHGRGRNGVPLPKGDAQHGYAAVWETIQAIEQGKPLPALAQQVRAARQSHTRTVTSLSADQWSGGGARCGNCGQFASAMKGHTCPHTTSGEELARKLMRSLAVPDSAYPTSALDQLIAEARAGGVSMRHPISGERIMATLDGLPVALAGGFVPDTWLGIAEIAVVVGGRVVPVLSMRNLTPAPVATDGVTAAALASGRVLTPGASVGSATTLPQRLGQQIQGAATTLVTGGDRYDQGRFMGSEYRKKSAQGQPITIDGVQWAVGQRASGNQYWASARKGGLAPTSGVTIGIGRTLPGAIELLKQPDTRVVELSDGQIQLYGGGGLLAVYDPLSGLAGDTNGTPNASSEQIAALIAYQALHPNNAYDRGLATDLAAALDGTGSSLIAIDAAYLAITNGPLVSGGTLMLGAQVGTQKCVHCGQFMGDAHICPSVAQQPAVSSTPRRGGVVVEDLPEDLGANLPPLPAPSAAAAAPRPDEAPPSSATSPATPQISVQLDPQALAAALAGALPAQQFDAQQLASTIAATLPPQQTLDPQAFAAALASALPQPQQLDPQVFAAALGGALAQQPAPPVNVQIDPAAMADAVRAGAAQAIIDAAQSGELRPQPIDPAVLADAIRAGMAAVPPPQVTVQAPAPAAHVQLQVDSAQLASALKSAIGDAANGPPPEPPAAPAPQPAPASRQPWQGRARPAGLSTTGQEHILSKVRLAAPDPYLMDVDERVGGKRDTPLQSFIPDIDPNYAISEETETILKSIAALMQAGQRVSGTAQRSCMAFGLYGPPGTGKNTLARQVAASIKTVDKNGRETQGMNYAEVNILPDSSIEDMIGTVVLEPDGKGGTRSAVRLGKIGLAAAMGSVVCVNEIVRNPKLATALQSMLEDGEIIIPSPEAGQIRIPVHPATLMFLTWNPGNEGDPDRPAQAPLSRITPFKLDKASDTERAQRAMSFLSQFDGQASSPNTNQREQQERRRKEIARRDYGIPEKIAPTPAEVKAAVKFIGAIEKLADAGVGARQIGLASSTSTAPGDRQLARFLVLGRTVGWQQATEMFKICCDQGDDFQSQWALIEERFRANYLRPDGTPVNFDAPPAQQ
jgi:MoxR-like ATPase